MGNKLHDTPATIDTKENDIDSLNEAQAALKAKMESYGEGHVFQYATDGLESIIVPSAVDMDRQKELARKSYVAETGSRFEGASIER